MQKNVDLLSGSAAPFPDDLLKSIASNRFLLTHSNNESSKVGLAISPLCRCTLFARLFSKAISAARFRELCLLAAILIALHDQLSQKTHLRMSILSLQSPSLDLADQDAYLALSENPEQIVIQRRDAATIAGYAFQRDIFGKSAFIVKIELPRKIADHGRMTLIIIFFRC